MRKKLALNPDASFEHADELILKGLFTTITNVNFFNDTIIELIHEVNVEKDRIYPDIMNYDVRHIWEDQEDIRSLKSLILFFYIFITEPPVQLTASSNKNAGRQKIGFNAALPYHSD